jgi:AraC-like DNA-binding protein
VAWGVITIIMRTGMVPHRDIRVVRHEAPGVRSEVALGVPAASLRGLVRGYQGFAERTEAPIRRREVPTGRGVLILDLGDGWDVAAAGGGDVARRRSFAAAVDDAPAFAAHDGRARCVQVDLAPLGVRALLGVPGRELTGRVVALEDLLGADAGRLVGRLADAPGWGERFAILDAVLGARAATAAAPRPDVAWAVARLEATDGRLPVADLARELGCSRRHLARHVGEEVGLGPKAFARVLRFRRAADLLADPAGPPPAAVAAACGFSDQAHLTREVAALAGLPPAALRAEARPHADGAGDAPVPFVQDPGAAAA